MKKEEFLEMIEESTTGYWIQIASQKANLEYLYLHQQLDVFTSAYFVFCEDGILFIPIHTGRIFKKWITTIDDELTEKVDKMIEKKEKELEKLKKISQSQRVRKLFR